MECLAGYLAKSVKVSRDAGCPGMEGRTLNVLSKFETATAFSRLVCDARVSRDEMIHVPRNSHPALLTVSSESHTEPTLPPVFTWIHTHGRG